MIRRAARVADRIHAKQRRKGNGQPYILHPIRVAGRVATLEVATDEMVAAAFLHDVIEDSEDRSAVEEMLNREFNEQVVNLVFELTAPSAFMDKHKTTREHRKMCDREHYVGSSKEAKIIKLCDRIDNVLEMQGLNQDFQRIYLRESYELLEVLRGAHEPLGHLLKQYCDDQNWLLEGDHDTVR